MSGLLHYSGYSACIRFSTADEVFHGKILGIDDLVVFEGASVKELKLAFEIAVKDYIDTCGKLGKVPYKTYAGTFNVRIGSQLHQVAAHFAAALNTSLNDFVKTAIEFTLANKDALKKI